MGAAKCAVLGMRAGMLVLRGGRIAISLRDARVTNNQLMLGFAIYMTYDRGAFDGSGGGALYSPTQINSCTLGATGFRTKITRSKKMVNHAFPIFDTFQL